MKLRADRAWTVDAVGAQEVVAAASAQKPIAGAVVPAATPFDRLRRFIDHNHRRGFIDLRSPRFGKLLFKLGIRRSRGAPVLGYVADGEYWLPDERFEQVVGGPREAAALKQDLLRRGILVTDRRGQGLSFVVKRAAPGWQSAVLRRSPAPAPEATGADASARGGGASVVGTRASSCLAGDRPTGQPDGGLARMSRGRRSRPRPASPHSGENHATVNMGGDRSSTRAVFRVGPRADDPVATEA